MNLSWMAKQYCSAELFTAVPPHDAELHALSSHSAAAGSCIETARIAKNARILLHGQGVVRLASRCLQQRAPVPSPSR